MCASTTTENPDLVQILIWCNNVFIGELISVLDGVPVAIKDEIDCLPYPTTGSVYYVIVFSGVIYSND
jgi:hypothetical protein